MRYDPVLFALYNIELYTARYEYQRDPFALTKLCEEYEQIDRQMRL